MKIKKKELKKSKGVKKEKNVNQKGITLIALVITVVIMLILAGVAISAVVGGDGLFGRVTNAKIKYEEASRAESELIQNLIEQIDSSMNGTTPPIEEGSTAITVKLAEGMVPVTYNESDSSWYVATEDEILNNTWYEYVDTSKEGQENQSKWANVMLRDNLQVEGVTNASTAELKDMYGKKVTSEGSMYVWVPRYAYKIPTGYHTDQAGEILIEFLNTDNTFKSGSNETLYLAPDETHNASNSYILHPAFKWAKEDGTEVALEGIWVGKFEASASDASYNTISTSSSTIGNVSTSDSVILRSIGNASSWRYICNHNIFLNCYNINSESNASKYGISTDKDKIDPHMMKNSEWGAAAYLAHSAYGRNGTEVTMNSTGYTTGNGNYKANVTMSTTGNVYGIYDMAGGAWERTAAYVDSTKGGTVSNEYLTSTSYGKAVYDAEDKYKDVYVAASTDNRENNYNANTNKYGDAVYETSLNSASPYTNGWYVDYTYFPYSSVPFFVRGGSYGNGAFAGVFVFSDNDGDAYSYDGFRAVLATL